MRAAIPFSLTHEGDSHYPLAQEARSYQVDRLINQPPIYHTPVGSYALELFQSIAGERRIKMLHIVEKRSGFILIERWISGG
jgi:hypothetical protein